MLTWSSSSSSSGSLFEAFYQTQDEQRQPHVLHHHRLLLPCLGVPLAGARHSSPLPGPSQRVLRRGSVDLAPPSSWSTTGVGGGGSRTYRSGSRQRRIGRARGQPCRRGFCATWQCGSRLWWLMAESCPARGRRPTREEAGSRQQRTGGTRGQPRQCAHSALPRREPAPCAAVGAGLHLTASTNAMVATLEVIHLHSVSIPALLSAHQLAGPASHPTHACTGARL